jgi:hypothetical protein
VILCVLSAAATRSTEVGRGGRLRRACEQSRVWPERLDRWDMHQFGGAAASLAKSQSPDERTTEQALAADLGGRLSSRDGLSTSVDRVISVGLAARVEKTLCILYWLRSLVSGGVTLLLSSD